MGSLTPGRTGLLQVKERGLCKFCTREGQEDHGVGTVTAGGERGSKSSSAWPWQLERPHSRKQQHTRKEIRAGGEQAQLCKNPDLGL